MKTYSKDRNKNTLELKTARDGPALTYFSRVLEAVMLKAANERSKMLSRSKKTVFSCVSQRRRQRGEKNNLPNTTSLSNKKGRPINFGTFAFAFIVGYVIGV